MTELCFCSPLQGPPQRGQIDLHSGWISSTRVTPQKGDSVYVAIPSMAFEARVIDVKEEKFQVEFLNPKVLESILKNPYRPEGFYNRLLLSLIDIFERILDYRGNLVRPPISFQSFKGSQELESKSSIFLLEWYKIKEQIERSLNKSKTGVKGWDIIAVQLGKEAVVDEIFCPELHKCLREIPDVLGAYFTNLTPHTKLPPHRGSFPGVMRFHLGLKVPKGKCFLSAGGQEVSWSTQKGFILDDTHFHWVNNETDEERTLLIVDLRMNSTFIDNILFRLGYGLLSFRSKKQTLINNRKLGLLT